VKIIAVGNEAMVKWASSYFVQPSVILKWVNFLQIKKLEGVLPADLWITSSDNFASWGGGDTIYHVEDLSSLIKAVDFISVHTYPMHDTHYNPIFWGITEEESDQSLEQKIESAMDRATGYAISQYEHTLNYMKSLGVEKPMHIGETGWASFSNGFYGENGAKATDEYKEALYYKKIRKWSEVHGVSCFYFEAFDENWKDAGNPGGSENFFGLFTIDGKAKFALWDYVDSGLFQDLLRDGNPIVKTYGGNKNALMEEVLLPPIKQVLEVEYH
jgi:exo-beta-1,3-glucanase (GH17 family)